mgnify:CR=1 FL=1
MRAQRHAIPQEEWEKGQHWKQMLREGLMAIFILIAVSFVLLSVLAVMDSRFGYENRTFPEALETLLRYLFTGNF